jgi:hypothetical protein
MKVSLPNSIDQRDGSSKKVKETVFDAMFGWTFVNLIHRNFPFLNLKS